MNGGVRMAGAIALVASWFGAALLTAASVARTAFAVLPSRELAGRVVGGVLPVVFVAGMVTGVAAAWLSIPRSGIRPALGAMLCVACMVAQFGIAPRIARLHAEMGPALDAISPDDPRRIAFGRLHAFSVGWLGIAMLAAAAFLILSVVAARPRP